MKKSNFEKLLEALLECVEEKTKLASNFKQQAHVLLRGFQAAFKTDEEVNQIIYWVLHSKKDAVLAYILETYRKFDPAKSGVVSRLTFEAWLR